MRHPLIIASSNQGKIDEFAQLLRPCPFNVLSASSIGGMPPVEENGSSFLENAIIKAEALHARAPEHHWVLADDSGLSVEALNGAPGVRSARFAGQEASDTENCVKLLAVLNKQASGCRTAKFECALCLIDDCGGQSYYTGSCRGHIAMKAQGTNGFGYDPLFIPDGYTTTFGVLDKEIKTKISHRAQACQNFAASFASL